jgi:hypothetical protein
MTRPPEAVQCGGCQGRISVSNGGRETGKTSATLVDPWSGGYPGFPARHARQSVGINPSSGS